MIHTSVSYYFCQALSQSDNRKKIFREILTLSNYFCVTFNNSMTIVSSYVNMVTDSTESNVNISHIDYTPFIIAVAFHPISVSISVKLFVILFVLFCFVLFCFGLLYFTLLYFSLVYFSLV